MTVRWLIRSQSLATLAAGMIYPYYLLFLKNLGSTYSAYGLAFAIFTVSSAASSFWLQKHVDRSSVTMMAGSSLGMMAAMLIFPWVPSFGFVLLLQAFMGVCNAMQKMSERGLLADRTEPGGRGGTLGNYHFWTSVSSGFAILIGGYIIDWLTIDVLFYVSAVIYGASAWLTLRMRGEGRSE
ncbi:MFS transporter [Paenibacillus roseipurpureus]|uniref:MFS transporter n=1 Tax=Paenibacillus roseopurpureus TaxID=2918901 RepID=A0AA96LMT5_9BACL|nr:MFS transporter [Paenibacillus sp. MBLB1832]WNR43996.1 MFS transporter [Paenibacillus sp. MBLB1832]